MVALVPQQYEGDDLKKKEKKKVNWVHLCLNGVRDSKLHFFLVYWLYEVALP